MIDEEEKGGDDNDNENEKQADGNENEDFMIDGADSEERDNRPEKEISCPSRSRGPKRKIDCGDDDEDEEQGEEDDFLKGNENPGREFDQMEHEFERGRLSRQLGMACNQEKNRPYGSLKDDNDNDDENGDFMLEEEADEKEPEIGMIHAGKEITTRQKGIEK